MIDAPAGSEDAEASYPMPHHGIASADDHRLGGWRYPDLQEAIAQARRIAATPSPSE